MLCRLGLPATLFDHAVGSRAPMGSGPSGVAGMLRKALQRNALQSLRFLASQRLQHLQRPISSRMHMRGRARASAGAFARGLGSVASVASVAVDKSIYISMLYLQRSPQRSACRAAQGVADHLCSIGSAAPQAIKYPRIFKGLGGAEPLPAGSGRNGVLAVSASAPARSARPRAELERGSTRAAGLALEQAEMGRFRPWSQSQNGASPLKSVRYQHVMAFAAPVERTGGRVASPSDPYPPSPADPYPPNPTAPFSAARLAAGVGPSGGFPGRSGENADRWGQGFRGSGAPGSGAAKTGALEKAGSGEVRHG